MDKHCLEQDIATFADALCNHIVISMKYSGSSLLDFYIPSSLLDIINHFRSIFAAMNVSDYHDV